MTGIQHMREAAGQLDSGRLLYGALLILITGLFSLAYLDTFKELWYYWIEGYNWQFVVPIAFVYMLWDRKDLYEGLPREPFILPGLILLLGGCSLLVVGQLSSTHSLREISIIINVFGLVFLLFGGKYVRNLFWPLIYLVLMTSLTSDLLEYLRYPLKLISATVSADVLKMAGFAVYREGTFLQLPHITLEVADSCSGLNQMVSSIALGIPIAFTFLNRWWKRILIILLSIVLGLVMNWVRVILISIWHYDSAKEVIHGPHGIYELPFVFLVGVVITLGVAIAISDESDKRVMRHHGAASGSEKGGAADRRILRAAVLVVMVLSVTAFYLNTWKAETIDLEGGFTGFPMSVAGYRGRPLGGLDRPFYTDVAHTEHIAGFVNQDGETARVYIGYFHSQDQQQELVDYRYNWLYDGADKVELPSLSPGYSMLKSRVKAGDRTVTVYFAYDINGRNIISPRSAKLASLFDALVRMRNNGAIIMVIFDRGVQELSDAEQELLVQVVRYTTDRLKVTDRAMEVR